MKEIERKKVSEAYTFFLKGYQPVDVARTLNLSLEDTKDLYKEYKRLKKII